MLGMEKKVRALYGDDVVGSQTGNPVVHEKETANSARAGLVISLLAILLALGAYVALDAKLTVVAQSVVDLPAKVSALDAKVATFENLPAKIRKQMVADRLAEIVASTAQLSAGLDSETHKAAMSKLSEMAKQLQADVAR